MTIAADPPKNTALAVDVDVATRTIRLRGELDETTKHLVEDAVDLLRTLDDDDLVVDARELTIVTTRGLDALARLRRGTSATGHRVFIDTGLGRTG